MTILIIDNRILQLKLILNSHTVENVFIGELHVLNFEGNVMVVYF